MSRTRCGAGWLMAVALATGCQDEVIGDFQWLSNDDVMGPSNVFVLVGDEGRRLVLDEAGTEVLLDVSEDAPDPEFTLHAVAAESGALIATGGDLTRKTHASWNHGLNWTTSASAEPALMAIDSDDGRFVAVGGDAVIAWTEPVEGEPVGWTAAEQGGAALRAIRAAGDGVFMTVGDGGRRLLSQDRGESWDLVAEGGDDLQGVAYGHGLDRWVAVGQGGRITWTGQVPSEWFELFEGDKWQDVIWDGARFVAVGFDTNPETGLIATSSDGENWGVQPVPVWLTSIVHHDGVYIGTSYSQNVHRSENLVDWSLVDVESGASLIDVVFAP